MREIATATVYHFIPVTLACGLAFVAVYYGVGKCLKVAGAFLWASGEAWEAGVSAARVTGKETFQRTVEGI
jgi:hypothetical protein